MIVVRRPSQGLHSRLTISCSSLADCDCGMTTGTRRTRGPTRKSGFHPQMTPIRTDYRTRPGSPAFVPVPHFVFSIARFTLFIAAAPAAVPVAGFVLDASARIPATCAAGLSTTIPRGEAAITRGPVRFATPSRKGTFTLYIPPACPGASLLTTLSLNYPFDSASRGKTRVRGNPRPSLPGPRT